MPPPVSSAVRERGANGRLGDHAIVRLRVDLTNLWHDAPLVLMEHNIS